MFIRSACILRHTHTTATIRRYHHHHPHPLKLITFIAGTTSTWQQSRRPKLTPTNIPSNHTRPMSAFYSSSSSSSSSSSLSSPIRFPHDMFACVDRRLGDLITEYPDIAKCSVTAAGANPQHSIGWFRVPEEGESEREALREADRRALAESKWKRPYAHLIEAGRDINSATGVKFGSWGPNIVCNFDSPLSRVECYRLVFTSDADDPQPWSNDWKIQSVIGYSQMPTKEEIQDEKNGYERALG